MSVILNDKAVDVIVSMFNAFKPTGHMMHYQFKIQQFYTLPTLYLRVLFIYIRTNNDLCPVRHKLIEFYNRVGKCLLRGSNWDFK
jgi:hypothetical protein